KLKPIFYLFSIFSAILNAAKLLIGVYAIKLIIDSVMSNQIETSLYLAFFVVFIQTIIYFLTKYLDEVNRVISADLRFSLNRHIVSRIMQFEYEKLEDPYYLDLRERAKFAADNQGVAWQLLSLLAQFITIMTTLIGLGIVLWMFDFWLVVALVVILIINIVIFALSNKYQIAVTNHLIPINRKFGYYLNTLLSGEN